ncbi:hypothetical protein EW145_g1131, partial [Phellinidium pouzarii]
RRAKRQQEKAEKEKLKAEARDEDQTASKEDMEKALLLILKKGETVLEALARLGEKVKKVGGKEKRAKKAPKARAQESSMDVDGTTPRSQPAAAPGAPSVQKTQIERLTSLASNLLSLGDVDIYNKTYEHLLRSVRSSGDVEPDWTPPAVKYEFKWDVPEAQAQTQTQNDAADHPQVFGPFGEDEMRAWYDANYFGASGEKVKVRVAQEQRPVPRDPPRPPLPDLSSRTPLELINMQKRLLTEYVQDVCTAQRHQASQGWGNWDDVMD